MEHLRSDIIPREFFLECLESLFDVHIPPSED